MGQLCSEGIILTYSYVVVAVLNERALDTESGGAYWARFGQQSDCLTASQAQKATPVIDWQWNNLSVLANLGHISLSTKSDRMF